MSKLEMADLETLQAALQQVQLQLVNVMTVATDAKAEAADAKAQATDAKAQAANAKAQAARAETEAEAAKRLLPLSKALFQRTFRYSDSNLGSARSTDFKTNLLKADSRDADATRARCYALNELPRHLVVAAHVFKHEWSTLAKACLDIDDVDDIRNGLLLYRPLEWAFDTGRLMFVAESGAFVLRLLDPAIREVSLHAKAAQLWRKHAEQQAEVLNTLT